MNKQDEALLAKAEEVLGSLARNGFPGPGVLRELITRLRELAPAEEPLADGYYWVRTNGLFGGWRHPHNESPTSIGRVFILEKNGNVWCSICNENPYPKLPDSFEVLGPVAPWVDPKYVDHPPFDEQGRPIHQNWPLGNP